ncbi:MAG TPA: 3-hydroxyacyl-CoA dehydrogenase family protein [Mycobacterium sp.]
MADDQVASRLAVLGAGVMGVSITTLALGHGVSVLLVDVDAAKLNEAHANIAKQLRLAQLMGVRRGDESIGELVTSTSVLDAAEATVVIEAITELPELKSKALGELSAVIRSGAPVVSNTSSIPIDELAGSFIRPEELAGVHFMNPPYLIETVEVIRGPRTSEATMRAIISLLDTLDLKAIVVKDAPGFVTSRILHPMINDAIRIVQAGTATADDVDALMQGCLGHRTGPLRTADLIGLDNLADSLRVLYERTGDEGCLPCELLLTKVRQGDLGRKSGRGFYHYEEMLP